jgi:hypothetical protein
MKPWMLPWLFPVGLVATVVLVTVFKIDGKLVLLAPGWLILALLGSIVFRVRDGEDPNTHYWRMRRR